MVSVAHQQLQSVPRERRSLRLQGAPPGRHDADATTGQRLQRPGFDRRQDEQYGQI
jgi:hypothetical protein